MFVIAGLIKLFLYFIMWSFAIAAVAAIIGLAVSLIVPIGVGYGIYALVRSKK